MSQSSFLDVSRDVGSLVSSPGFVTAFVVIGGVYLVREAYRTNFPKVKGIPEVPGALPFIGHLNQLGGRNKKNDGTVFTEWRKKLGNPPLFQCVMGDQRTVIVSDYQAIHDIWVGHSNELSDRPSQPGFLEKLGVDLTGFSMTPQLRRCRAAAMRALAKPAWPKYYPLIEPSSSQLVEGLYNQGDNGRRAIDSYAYMRHLVFDLTLTLSYGVRFGKVDDPFTLQLIRSINEISAVRSSSKSYRHFVPITRIVPELTSRTIAAEKVRSKHIKAVYDKYLQRVATGETVDCIVASLGKDKLTEEEIHGTCISLLQAAPDTVASAVYQAIAWLSAAEEGRKYQEIIYNAIMEAYGGHRDLAWKSAFRDDKTRVEVARSVGMEALRFWTTTPYAVPRSASQDIQYGDIFIPKGMTVLMNAQEANHDESKFGPDAWEFNPLRYMGQESALPHLAFGAGSRICPAAALSNRIIYAMIVRLVLAFKMEEDKNCRTSNLDAIEFSDLYGEVLAHPRFYDCKFTARDEAWLKHIVATENSE